MILKPCPVCGNTKKLLFQVLGDVSYKVSISTDIVGTEKEMPNQLIVLVQCPTCTVVLDPALVVGNWTLPELKQDKMGYYVERSSREPCVLEDFLFKLPTKWYINEESKLGMQFIESLQIANAKTVAELPTSLVSKNKGLRRFAAQRLKELKGGRNEYH